MNLAPLKLDDGRKAKLLEMLRYFYPEYQKEYEEDVFFIGRVGPLEHIVGIYQDGGTIRIPWVEFCFIHLLPKIAFKLKIINRNKALLIYKMMSDNPINVLYPLFVKLQQHEAI